jgi:hypothetical protein
MFYSKMHPGFTSSLNDLRLKNLDIALLCLSAFCSQIVQVQRKSGHLSGHNIFSEALIPMRNHGDIIFVGANLVFVH